jgi:16S rRNA (uracil1498-N3)-methyltransferase
MDIPYFYHHDITEDTRELSMPEESTRHIVSVLRMREGDPLMVVNGTGLTATATVMKAHRKSCVLSLSGFGISPDTRRPVSMGISLLKNAARFEWMLEKATEIGVRAIIPLLCDRTERQHFRSERLRGIVISAMLQSKQAWMTEICEPVKFGEFVASVSNTQRYIAHCLPGNHSNLTEIHDHETDSIILIGPEGDFTESEIGAGIQNGFKAVSLGKNRLRTETAGVVAAALMCIR